MKIENLEEWAKVPFRDQQEMIEVMSTPEYRSTWNMHSALRDAVMKKLELDTGEIRVSGTVGAQQQSVVMDTAAALHGTEAGKTQAEQIAEDRKALAASHGNAAVGDASTPQVSTQTEGVTRATIAVPGAF